MLGPSVLVALAQSLRLGLSLLKDKKAQKYLDELVQIQQDLNDEFLLTYETQSDERIIELQSRLLDINKALQAISDANSGK